MCWKVAAFIFVVLCFYSGIYGQNVGQNVDNNVDGDGLDVCDNEKFLIKNYPWLQFSDLFEPPYKDETTEIYYSVPFYNFNGIDYVRLVNPATVFWIKPYDYEPDYIMLIETENGKQFQKPFEIGLEANGHDPQKQFQIFSNSIKIYLENKLCIPYYKFYGLIRYIISVNETGSLKASFYHGDTGKNIKLYFLEEEKYGVPKVAVNETNFEKILLPFTTSTTTTTTTTSKSGPSISKKSTTIQGSTKSLVTEKSVESKIDDEFSQSYLIPIIIVVVLLLFICCIIFCALRYRRRRRQRQKLETKQNKAVVAGGKKEQSKSIASESYVLEIVPMENESSSSTIISM